MGVEVRARDGRIWKLTRRPVGPRWRRVELDYDGSNWMGSSGGDLWDIALSLLLPVIWVVFVILFLPALLFLGELLLLPLAAFLWFGRWRLRAESSPERREWVVRGWNGSRRARDEVAAELRRGVVAAPSPDDLAR